MSATYKRLAGGDLRSKGASDAVAVQAEQDPSIVGDLIAGLHIQDPVIRMRCADALEKLTRKRPEYLESHGLELLALLNPAKPRELLWHIIQMAPRIHWPVKRLPAVFRAVEGCLSADSSIVKVSAMQALWELLEQDRSRTAAVEAVLRACIKNGTPAMKARGRKLLASR